MWFSLNLQSWFVPPIRFFSHLKRDISRFRHCAIARCFRALLGGFQEMFQINAAVMGFSRSSSTWMPVPLAKQKWKVQVTVNEGVFSFVGCDDVFCFSLGWNGCHQEHMEELIYNGYLKLEVRCYLLSLFIFVPYFTCRCWKLSFLVNSPESLRPRMYNVTFLRTQHICRVLQGPGLFKGRGCSWGSLRIPFGKIGEP